MASLGYVEAKDVHESPRSDPVQSSMLLGVKPDGTPQTFGVVNVPSLRSDVEISNPDEGVLRVEMAFQKSPEPQEPLQLVLKPLRIRSRPLGDVGVQNRDSPDPQKDQPRLVARAVIIEPNLQNLHRFRAQY